MLEKKLSFSIGLTGMTRKETARIVAEALEGKEQYIGAPRFCYIVVDKWGREWQVLKDKAIEIQEQDQQVQLRTPLLEKDEVDSLYIILAKLKEEGSYANPSCRMVIGLEAEGHTDKSIAIFKKVFESKQELILQAMGIQQGELTTTEDSIVMSFFNSTLEIERLQAYITFCIVLNEHVLTLKSASSKPTVTDNPKFTFRVFLLRLGMVGKEYKETRKVLLEKLSGNSAFRHGKPSKNEEESETCED